MVKVAGLRVLSPIIQAETNKTKVPVRYKMSPAVAGVGRNGEARLRWGSGYIHLTEKGRGGGGREEKDYRG